MMAAGPIARMHTFRTTPHVYNVSPFAIKVESFLRINKIPFEVVYDNKFSKKGQIPWIELNGEQVADSNVIIPRLKKVFQVDPDSVYSKEQLAVAHSTLRMLEEHTAQIGFYYRYGLHMQELYDALDIPGRLFKAQESCMGSVVSYFWRRFQPKQTKKKTKLRGLACHSDEELWSFSFDDLRAMSDYLGDKRYFLGATPSTIDCAIFGHLSQFLFIPIGFPQKAYMQENCPNLIEFVDRFKAEYWPDWEEKCKGESSSDAKLGA